MSKLIKTVHRHREEYPGENTQREIDLACFLKDKKGKYILYPSHFFRCFPLYKCIYFVYLFLYNYLLSEA